MPVKNDIVFQVDRLNLKKRAENRVVEQLDADDVQEYICRYRRIHGECGRYDPQKPDSLPVASENRVSFHDPISKFHSLPRMQCHKIDMDVS